MAVRARTRLLALVTMGTVAFSLNGEFARASSESTLESAKQEGALIIYSSTSGKFARNVVEEFKSLYPGIAVTYLSLAPAEIDARVRQEAATSSGPDVVWSSAMDLQMKAVRDGLALPYKSLIATSIAARYRRTPYRTRKSAHWHSSSTPNTIKTFGNWLERWERLTLIRKRRAPR